MEPDSQKIDIGFCDLVVANAVVKKYKEMFPNDDYTPEVEADKSIRRWSAIIRVPLNKYVMFDAALSAVLGF